MSLQEEEGLSEGYFNPLTPKNDQIVTSPYNIHTVSCKQVLRVLKLIEVDILI